MRVTVEERYVRLLRNLTRPGRVSEVSIVTVALSYYRMVLVNYTGRIQYNCKEPHKTSKSIAYLLALRDYSKRDNCAIGAASVYLTAMAVGGLGCGFPTGLAESAGAVPPASGICSLGAAFTAYNSAMHASRVIALCCTTLQSRLNSHLAPR